MVSPKIACFLATIAGWVWTGTLWAGPSELNFQGVLLDSSGNGVTGTRAMTLKLYDAAIGGNLLYTEDLGNVSVNKGVYSFNFGTNGTGNPKVTEIVAIATGTNSTFQKILGNTNVVAGSVTVTDGTYSWDQVNGSSDAGVNFDASYSTSLKRITVNYYTGAPVAGKTIRVTYRSPSAGLAGVLTNENDPWLEILVGGAPQSPRSKLTSAPFSLRAARVDEDTYLETKEIDLPVKRVLTIDNRGSQSIGTRLPVGIANGQSVSWQFVNLIYDLPHFVREIISLNVNYTVTKLTVYSNSYFGRLDFSLLDSTDQQISSYSFPRSETASSTVAIPVNRTIPYGESYRLIFSVWPGIGDGSAGYSNWGGGSINSITAKVKVPKTLSYQTP